MSLPALPTRRYCPLLLPDEVWFTSCILTLLVPEPHTVPTYQETLLIFDASASFLRTTVVGPGEYVYEPSGNVDWWRANAASQRAELERYRQMQRVARPDLVG